MLVFIHTLNESLKKDIQFVVLQSYGLLRDVSVQHIR